MNPPVLIVVEAIGLVVLFWSVGIVLLSFFTGEPDHDVDIRDQSRNRLKTQITRIHNQSQGHRNANHPRR